TEQCFFSLEAPVLRVGGYDTPYPPSKLEEEYLPDLDRVLDAVDRATELGVMPDLRHFNLPDVGEGLTEGGILQWLVAVGNPAPRTKPVRHGGLEIGRQAEAHASAEDAAPAHGAAPGTRPHRPLAKPPVRKYAKDLGVDLTTVHGSGEGGTITRADIDAAAAG